MDLTSNTKHFLEVYSIFILEQGSFNEVIIKERYLKRSDTDRVINRC